MDLLLIFQQLQSGKLTMEQELTCSAYAKTMGGSEIWLKEGERMTVEELLKALGGSKAPTMLRWCLPKPLPQVRRNLSG